jgi:hypothetical protein
MVELGSRPDSLATVSIKDLTGSILAWNDLSA